jgi:hypothetical protein
MLAVLLIAVAIAVIAYAAFARQAGIWCQQQRSVNRADALNAARSGADFALALMRTGGMRGNSCAGSIENASFNVIVEDGRIVSRGASRQGRKRVEEVVVVRVEKEGSRVRVLSWTEE